MSITLNASTSSGFVQSADNSGEIELQSNGTTALKVNTNEGIQILNCLGVGNATPSTSGAGITFPAAQSASSDANTLDDYEEGTYTPSLRGIETAGTFSPSGAQTGYYVKIGKLVYAQFDVNGSVSGSTSSLGIALPFTGGTGSYPGSFCCGYFSVAGATNATWIGGYVDQGTAFVTVTYNASSNSTVNYYPVPVGNIRFIGTVMFEVA